MTGLKDPWLRPYGREKRSRIEVLVTIGLKIFGLLALRNPFSHFLSPNTFLLVVLIFSFLCLGWELAFGGAGFRLGNPANLAKSRHMLGRGLIKLQFCVGELEERDG